MNSEPEGLTKAQQLIFSAAVIGSLLIGALLLYYFAQWYLWIAGAL